MNFINECWTAYTDNSGETYIAGKSIFEEKPPEEQAKIAKLLGGSTPLMEVNARLIAHAPDMFRVMCNVAGEVEYGTTKLPEGVMRDINSLLHDILRREKEEE